MDEEAYAKSLKADIIPIINAELRLDEARLYSLSIEVLNEIFNILQIKVIPVERLREIISSRSSSAAVMNAIMKEPRSLPPIENTPQTPSSVDIPEPSQAPIRLPEANPTQVKVPESKPSPVSVPEFHTTPVSVPETSPSPVSVPDMSTTYRTPGTASLSSQDSIKADIVPNSDPE